MIVDDIIINVMMNRKCRYVTELHMVHSILKFSDLSQTKEDTNVGDGKITITSAPYQSYSVVVNPRISLEFPQNIKINETVIINYTVDWIHEDGTILYILPLNPHGIPLVAASIDFGLIESVSMINSEVNLIFGAVNTSFP